MSAAATTATTTATTTVATATPTAVAAATAAPKIKDSKITTPTAAKKRKISASAISRTPHGESRMCAKCGSTNALELAHGAGFICGIEGCGSRQIYTEEEQRKYIHSLSTGDVIDSRKKKDDAMREIVLEFIRFCKQRKMFVDLCGDLLPEDAAAIVLQDPSLLQDGDE